MLRNIPDYFVNTPNGPLVVQVKGSPNFKKKEIDLMPLFLENYSSKGAPLVYAFCFEFCAPKLVYPERLIELYKNTVEGLVTVLADSVSASLPVVRGV